MKDLDFVQEKITSAKSKLDSLSTSSTVQHGTSAIDAGAAENHELSDTSFFSKSGLTEENYYIEVATLSGFEGTINKIKYAGTEFGTEDIYVSLGRNYFIQSKAWKIEENVLYIACPIICYEDSVGHGELEINNVQAKIPCSQTTALQPVAFSSAKTLNYESQSTVTVGGEENNSLQLTLNLQDGAQRLALEYGTTDSTTSSVLSKVVFEGKTTYVVGRNKDNALDFYPLIIKNEVQNLKVEYGDYIGKTIHITTSEMGKLYSADILVSTETTPPPSPPETEKTITFVDSATLESEISEQYSRLCDLLLDQENLSGEPQYHEFSDNDEFFGSGTRKFTEDDYFAKYAAITGFDEITTVKVGTQEFGTEDVNISVGNNHFIKARAWRVVDNYLEVSILVLFYEMAADKGTVVIDGVTAIPYYQEQEGVNLTPKAFNDAYKMYDESISKSTVTKGATEDNVLNVTINLKDGKQAVALEFGEQEGISLLEPAMVKIVKGGVVSYALSKPSVVNGIAVLSVYPVAWKEQVENVQMEYASDIGTTVEISAFIHRTFFNAKITITSE